MYEFPHVEAVIVIDACNAFNSLNRQAALWNIEQIIIMSFISTVLINAYREDVPNFIGDETFSEEGTMLGDPLAMAMYVLSITPYALV